MTTQKTKNILKPLIFALAFTGTAHADQTITNNNGVKLTISAASAREAVTGYSTSPTGEVLTYTVYGCYTGRGDVEMHRGYRKGKEFGQKYLNTVKWDTTMVTPTSRISVYLCATALAKTDALK